jgi:hypothetical protein
MACGHAPGEGVVGGETGRLLLGISATGDVTVISEHGKCAGDRAAAICDLLAAALQASSNTRDPRLGR